MAPMRTGAGVCRALVGPSRCRRPCHGERQDRAPSSRPRARPPRSFRVSSRASWVTPMVEQGGGVSSRPPVGRRAAPRRRLRASRAAATEQCRPLAVRPPPTGRAPRVGGAPRGPFSRGLAGSPFAGSPASTHAVMPPSTLYTCGEAESDQDLRGGLAAVAGPADHVDRLVRRQLGGRLRLEIAEGDQHGSRGRRLGPLLRLAHVHQLGVLVGGQRVVRGLDIHVS